MEGEREKESFFGDVWDMFSTCVVVVRERLGVLGVEKGARAFWCL
jgi:hypothetical protein